MLELSCPCLVTGLGLPGLWRNDAVWWIGFSWSSKCKILSPCRRVGFSTAKSCYRIRPCSLLSACGAYCRIFSQIDGENQGYENIESNTLILSEGVKVGLATQATVYADFALTVHSSRFVNQCRCILSLCLQRCVFLFIYLFSPCLYDSGVVGLCSFTQSHQPLVCEKHNLKHGHVFVCVMCSH